LPLNADRALLRQDPVVMPWYLSSFLRMCWAWCWNVASPPVLGDDGLPDLDDQLPRQPAAWRYRSRIVASGISSPAGALRFRGDTRRRRRFVERAAILRNPSPPPRGQEADERAERVGILCAFSHREKPPHCVIASAARYSCPDGLVAPSCRTLTPLPAHHPQR